MLTEVNTIFYSYRCMAVDWIGLAPHTSRFFFRSVHVAISPGSYSDFHPLSKNIPEVCA